MTTLWDHPLLRDAPSRRRLVDMVWLFLVVVAGAAGLQLFWIGAHPFNGAGPGVWERWFYSACLMMTLVLVPWSALRTDRAWSRIRQQGILHQLQLSRLSPHAMGIVVLGTSMAPLLGLLLLSALGWAVLSAIVGAPSIGGVLLGHGLVMVQVLAYGMAGQAGTVLLRRPSLAGPLAVLCLLLTSSLLFLAEPLLTRVPRPDLWIGALLLVNPVTTMGAALGLDVLRTPWLYALTSAPEYRFAYPSPWFSLALNAGVALWLTWRMCRHLRYE